MAINTPANIHNLVMCANIFIRKDGNYLMLKRSPLKKYLPNRVHPIGGKVDANEDPYMGAIREVQEEAGITVKNMRLEAVVLELAPEQGKDENWLIFHFSADYDTGEITTTEEGEFVMLTAEELVKADLFQSVRAIIHHILDHTDGTTFLTMEYEEGQAKMNAKKVHVCVV